MIRLGCVLRSSHGTVTLTHPRGLAAPPMRRFAVKGGVGVEYGVFVMNLPKAVRDEELRDHFG